MSRQFGGGGLRQVGVVVQRVYVFLCICLENAMAFCPRVDMAGQDSRIRLTSQISQFYKDLLRLVFVSTSKYAFRNLKVFRLDISQRWHLR